MEILDYIGIPQLGISAEACKKYSVAQVKTKQGIKFAAIFSEQCYKVLSLDGSSFWYGDYDASFGLFGQKAVPPGKNIIIVSTEFECLRLASLGFDAVCLPNVNQVDEISFSILSDNLRQVGNDIWVWEEIGQGVRQKTVEKFLIHLSSIPQFNIRTIDGSNVPILTTHKDDITDILKDVVLKPWKPKGIMYMEEILESNAFKEPITGYSTGYKCIDIMNGGIRRGELTAFTAGSGVGKSTILREIGYHLGCNENQKVSFHFFEEKVDRTAKCLAAIRYNIPVDKLRKDSSLLTKEQWKEFNNDPRIRNNFVFHNHFGSLDSDDVLSKIEYVIKYEGCKFILLDHISIMVSGLSSKEGERKDIDILMTRLATLAVTYDVAILFISHLSVPEGLPHEEGGRVTLSQLRGSGSIKQLSASLFALERNQQDPNSTMALLRQLKGREMGKTGPCGVLNYITKTGRLIEVEGADVFEFEASLKPKGKRKSSGGYQAKTTFGSGY